MKKIIMFALFLLVFGSIPAFCGNGPNFPREDDNQAGFVNVGTVNQNVSAVVINRPALVYGVTTYASSANGHCDLYDASSAPTLGSPKIEVGSATQFASVRQPYTTPATFNAGVYVVSSSATCQVEYR